MQIQLDRVTPTYFEREKINGSGIWDKNISFKKGEHVQIIAPSGSGKTSLIHFIYRLRNDYAGNILYDNLDTRNLTLDNLSIYRQKKISIIFQDLRLFPDQTVYQNLELKRQLNPFHPPEMITKMAARLGIESRLQKTARICSYGEQQRVAIIRSLMQPFDFLLLDEPFSHLDDVNRSKAMDLIAEECSARNASMIFADLQLVDFFRNAVVYQL